MTSPLVYIVANSRFDTKFGLLTRQTILTKPPKPTISVMSFRPSGHTCKKRDIAEIYLCNFFWDFPQNFRLRMRNQYCTQAIAWGSTILDGGSTILDGSSTIFCRFSPFFVDFHHFLSIFTIYALLSRFTFCRDLRTFSANSFWPK